MTWLPIIFPLLRAATGVFRPFFIFPPLCFSTLSVEVSFSSLMNSVAVLFHSYSSFFLYLNRLFVFEYSELIPLGRDGCWLLAASMCIGLTDMRRAQIVVAVSASLLVNMLLPVRTIGHDGATAQSLPR